MGEIHKEWTAAGVSASRTTTHRRMQDMGSSCRIPCVKPLLNNRQRQKRLAWAKDKKDWTAAEWSKVMFSDESKFCISFGNQGPRVWRKRGEAHNASVITEICSRTTPNLCSYFFYNKDKIMKSLLQNLRTLWPKYPPFFFYILLPEKALSYNWEISLALNAETTCKTVKPT